MNDINELVDLPDPATHPLVHPLDLPQARRPFRTSWLIGARTSPPVAALVAVIVWFASHNYLVPLVAGAAIVGFGELAGRVYREQAWAFIPRRRQDRRRPRPALWELGPAWPWPPCSRWPWCWWRSGSTGRTCRSRCGSSPSA
jgi:hypothetical protein